MALMLLAKEARLPQFHKFNGCTDYINGKMDL